MEVSTARVEPSIELHRVLSRSTVKQAEGETAALNRTLAAAALARGRALRAKGDLAGPRSRRAIC
ncbi:MAG: hypothetical protein HYV07_17725 [Deltaproteobacteria bacterium]|nr:hypothetical protein [Deltaproteobacteria bacterium]